jgi:hypothetical protein
MVVLLGFMALSVDIGIACSNQAELQRSADAAAISATTHLLDQRILNPMLPQDIAQAMDTAAEFASSNSVGRVNPVLAPYDVEVGYISDLEDPSSSMVNVAFANSARVRVQRSELFNGKTPFFFGRIYGKNGMSQGAEGTAAFNSSFRGFTTGSNGDNLGFLPIALDKDTWNALKQGMMDDNWSWDPADKTISSGSDGIPELNLYPQGIGLPGNRGTVDVGHAGNSTNDIKRQILDGISKDDLSHHGGKLELDYNGELQLNGDTGISAGIKEQLNQIKGEPRIIPIFDYAAGNGNNANFTIVEFVGVRIMEVKLTGKMSSKRLMVQPAAMRTLGGIPGGDDLTSEFIYSPVRLIR